MELLPARAQPISYFEAVLFLGPLVATYFVLPVKQFRSVGAGDLPLPLYTLGFEGIPCHIVLLQVLWTGFWLCSLVALSVFTWGFEEI